MAMAVAAHADEWGLAIIGHGHQEFSINDRPERRRPFDTFRAPREFAWEVAAIGLNLVNMASDQRAKGVSEKIQKLSEPDGATITVKGRYAEVEQQTRSNSPDYCTEKRTDRLTLVLPSDASIVNR
jgi:hypothetical protein